MWSGEAEKCRLYLVDFNLAAELDVNGKLLLWAAFAINKVCLVCGQNDAAVFFRCQACRVTCMVEIFCLLV